MRGQTNFVRSLFQLNRVYRPELLLADHETPVSYEIRLPPPPARDQRVNPASLYVHAPRGRRGRAIDAATEEFVDETRVGTRLVKTQPSTLPTLCGGAIANP